MTGPTVGGLFAGYGGVELALHDVWPDARPMWFSQYDPEGGKRQAPSRILAHHWPDVPNHGDITTINWSKVEPVDILTGGFPCQDVSAAGKRRGLVKGATRSGLWGAMATAIEALHPRLVVIENVRGLLSARAGSDVEQCAWCVGGPADGEPALRALGAVLGDLADLGYDAAWVGLRAADVGAPHGRFRVFVLAWPAGDAHGASGQEALGWASAGAASDAIGGVRAGLTLPVALAIEAQRMLLPTPTAQVGINGGTQDPAKRKAGGHTPTIADIAEWHLLPTPRATDGTNGGPNQRGSSGDLMLPSAVALLPTPTSTDAKASGSATYAKTDTHHTGTTLTDALVRKPWSADVDSTPPDAGQGVPGVRSDLQSEAVQRGAREQPALPVEGLLLAELREHPAEREKGHGALARAEASRDGLRGVLEDHRPARSPRRSQSDKQRPGEPLDAVRVVSSTPALAGGSRCPHGGGATCGGHSTAPWGAYEAAIRRWEVLLGRPAPDPTEPTGRGGAHRLSPALVEFLMGIPAGHVTDVPGITRNDMLKALGNGVVPQQCATAVRHLLGVRESAIQNGAAA